MGSVYRDRDRYDDTRSVASTRRDDGDRSYTKVTRYIIREDDDQRSNYTSRRQDSPEPQRETIRITRREVEDQESVASPRRHVPSYVEKDFVIRGGRGADTRSPRAWERGEDVADRELVIRRSDDRADGPRREVDRESLTIAQVDDRRDSQRYNYDAYQSGAYGQDRDRNLQRYTRTAEYYGPPQQPQTIIIRQDPIIIREQVRDDDYQMVRRSDVDDERSVATTRRGEPRDEEYFYEKKVRERYDDYDRKGRREISPHDSISQVGRRRDSYSSDDSMVYVKRVERDSRSRGSSSDGQKKDLAAGVIAGVGAAELLRNHRKKEGRDVSEGVGRVGRDVGAGAIGALAAEGIRRYRSKSRHGSRDRDRDRSSSYDRYGRDSRDDRDRRGRSRSRSGSRPNLKTLGALGLGAVAVAAAASLATRKMGEKDKKEKESRRSRSRRRSNSRGSVESLSDLENDPKAKDSRNPKRRNSRIAAAGAVGAAGAALLARARSKSRGGHGSREHSQTRLQQGLPIAAAGLGTAALAGLYENNKAKREAEQIQAKQKRRSRSESGTRRSDRSDSQYGDRSRGVDPGLVEYGYGDVEGNNYGPEYYGRQPPQEPYYGGNAVVPAGRTRSRSRSLSRDRRGARGMSPSSADDGTRRRGEAAGVAAGAIAATDHEQRKAERRERRARRRAQEAQDAGRDPYEDAYAPQQAPQPPWTPPPADAYAQNQGFGGQYQSSFPPPPGSIPQGLPAQFQPQYQPPTAQVPAAGRYTPQNAYAPQQPFNHQAYPAPQPSPGMPQQPGFHDPFNTGGATPYPQQPQYRGNPDQNVSAGHPFSQYAPPTNDQPPFDGVNNYRSIGPTPPPPAPTPAIRIHSPPNASTPSLAIPQTYIPPADRPDFQSPNDEGGEKGAQFASSPEASRSTDPDHNHHHRSNTMDSDSISPDARRQRRRQQESNRGYEAGDDTDLSPNSERRASRIEAGRDQPTDRGLGGSSRRERMGDRSLRPEDNDQSRRRSSEHRRDRHSSRSDHIGDRPPSPAESDATVDLPPRFDEKGRKRGDKGEDPFGDTIDNILKGKGTAGKVFGNFMDGIFGPDNKNKGIDDAGEGGSRRRH